jgi:hypothetical protein
MHDYTRYLIFKQKKLKYLALYKETDTVKGEVTAKDLCSTF